MDMFNPQSTPRTLYVLVAGGFTCAVYLFSAQFIRMSPVTLLLSLGVAVLLTCLVFDPRRARIKAVTDEYPIVGFLILAMVGVLAWGILGQFNVTGWWRIGASICAGLAVLGSVINDDGSLWLALANRQSTPDDDRKHDNTPNRWETGHDSW